MAKIPVKAIIKTAKVVAPKAKDFIKEHPKLAMGLVTGLGKVGKDFMDTKENRAKKKLESGKIPFRKRQYQKYHSEILPEMDSYTYIQLNSFRQEVNSYINQINEERSKRKLNNKILHEKRAESWRQILIQIEDKMKNRNYEELLKAYNSSTYESKYFDKKVIDRLRTIESKDELYNYVHLYTGKDMTEIERDFF